MAKDTNTKSIGKILHGQGKSSRVIASACNIDVKTAQKWIDAWEAAGFAKGYLGSKLDQAEEAAAIKAREKKGLTKAHVEAKVLKLMEAQKGVFFQGVRCETVEDNGTQVAATSLAADILHMKRNPEEEALTAGIYAFYKNQLAQNRAKK